MVGGQAATYRPTLRKFSRGPVKEITLYLDEDRSLQKDQAFEEIFISIIQCINQTQIQIKI